MFDDERITDIHQNINEERSEFTLRPQHLDEYIGQKAVTDNLKVFIEAAKLDGAGEWQIFTKVCLPQCRAALYSIAILVFIDYWNMVEQPMIFLEREQDYPLSVFLAAVSQGDIGIQSVCGLLCLVPVTFFFLYYREELTDGLKDVLWG